MVPDPVTNPCPSRHLAEDKAGMDIRASHAGCLLCGDLHPRSWGLCFEPAEEGGVQSSVFASPDFQGYDNLLHGGVIAALLDAAMIHCLFALGIEAVTGELRVRFHQPIACGTLLDLRGWLVFSCPPLYHLNAEIRWEGRLMTSAEAKCMRRQHP